MTKVEILNNIVYKWMLAALKNNSLENKRKVAIIWDCISDCSKTYPEKAIQYLNEFKQTEQVKEVKKYIMEHYNIKETAAAKEGELF